MTAAFNLAAQNTIGGVKASVPEAEVKRQSMFLAAEKERMLEHWDKAVEAYKGFLFDNPKEDAAWYGLARTYAAKNDAMNAMDAIEKAIQIAPENQWYLIFQADLYEKNGRNKDALETYDLLVKRFPDTPEFYEKQAYLAVLTGDPKRGLKALDKLETLVGVTEENTAKKHLIYVGMGDDKKAADEYKKLIAVHPQTARFRYQLADFYERTGDKAAAKKTWEEVLQAFPDDPIARLALSGKENNPGADRLSSLESLFSDPRVSIDSKIKELVPYLSKMESDKDQSLNQKLLDLGALLEKTHPDEAKAWSISGDMYYLLNRTQEALDRYRHCISLNPSVFAVWDNTLSILLAQKNYSEAEKTAEKALDAFPNQPRAYMQFAVAAIALGHFDDAISQLNQAALMSGANPALKAEILDLMGDAWLGKGDKNKAKENWAKSLELNKNPAVQEKISRIQ